MEQPEQPSSTPKQSTPTITRIKARFQVRPPRWLRTAFEQGPEQLLPVALLFGLVASMGSLFTSASMLYLHFPVHTVLCHNQDNSGSLSNSPAACYPNFFLSTWMLIFCASVLSGFFYTFICMQQEQLRLRQGVAMLGSFFTVFLWLSIILFGFLPAQISIDSKGITNKRADHETQVHAYGMLSSSIENYMYAHNKTQIPSDSDAISARTAQLIWVVGGGNAVPNTTPSNGKAKAPGIVMHFYYKRRNNQFVYDTDNVPVPAKIKAKVPRGASRVDGPVTQAHHEQAGQQPQQVEEQTGPEPSSKNSQVNTPPLGAKKMIGNQPRSMILERSQPAFGSARWNMYARKMFYKEETRMALAAAILAPISCLVSLNVFLLLCAYPFI